MLVGVCVCVSVLICRYNVYTGRFIMGEHYFSRNRFSAYKPQKNSMEHNVLLFF